MQCTLQSEYFLYFNPLITNWPPVSLNLLHGPCKCRAPLILETWYGPVTVDYHVFDQVQFVIATQKSPLNLVRRLFTYF